MGAKIVLTGEAKGIEKQNGVISFTIVTGPATRHPPRGLRLYGQTRYRVECTTRQWRRARHSPDDRSALCVEGYLEPRRDELTGQLYVAVVATSIQSKLMLNHRKLGQLREVLEQARESYCQARESGAPRDVLEERAAAFVKANENVQAFLKRYPELSKEGKA